VFDIRLLATHFILSPLSLVRSLACLWCRYPIVASSELTSKEPYAIHILGDPLVLYRDANGKATCLEDKCPHRSAPLSVGVMRDQTLECKYHGWQFGVDGACVSIPSEGSESKNSIRVQRYPTEEQYGLVWVWMGDIDAASSELLPHFLFDDLYGCAGWTFNFATRDLEVDHGLLIENLLDPSHLPFTHEGTISKRSEAQKMTFTVDFDNTQSSSSKLDTHDDKTLQRLKDAGFIACSGDAIRHRDNNKLGNFCASTAHSLRHTLSDTHSLSHERMLT